MSLSQKQLTWKQKRNQKNKIDAAELLVENRESIPDSVASIFFIASFSLDLCEIFAANFGDPEQEREAPSQNQYLAGPIRDFKCS